MQACLQVHFTAKLLKIRIRFALNIEIEQESNVRQISQIFDHFRRWDHGKVLFVVMVATLQKASNFVFILNANTVSTIFFLIWICLI